MSFLGKKMIKSEKDTVIVKDGNANGLAFLLCTISYLFCGTASTIMSTYLPNAISELLNEQITEAKLGEVGAYINAVSLYGWMFGGILFGILADRMGRKKSWCFQPLCTALLLS